MGELVKKCGNNGYKKRNGDKCKVVETIDLVLVEDANKGKIDSKVIVSDVRIMDGKVPEKFTNSKSTNKEETMLEEEEDNIKYEDPAVQKEDIVNAIKTKTEKEMEKLHHNDNRNELAMNNEIQTYDSSEIMTSEKVKKKKDKKNKEEKKKKKK